MRWKTLLLNQVPRDGADPGQQQQQQQPTPPWYEGKADVETIGHWDNKGWKKDDPAAIAIEATKQARELQKHFGVPAEQLIKLPKDTNDQAGWDGVYQRLGVPKEAKEYELTLKHADGSDISQALADTIRNSAIGARVAKERFGEFAKQIVKNIDDTRAAEKADFDAKLGTEKATLAKNWGTQPDRLDAHQNMLNAKLGAARLGITPEAVAALEKTIGYAAVMEAMRKIGAGTTEDTFHEGGGGGGQNVTTLEGAHARKAELMADEAWVKRYLDGSVTEVREMTRLDHIIAGAA